MAEFFDGFEQFRTGDKIPLTDFMGMAGYITRGELSSGAGRLSASNAIFTSVSQFAKEWVWDGDTITIGFAAQQNGRTALFGIRMGDSPGKDVPHVLVFTDVDSALINVTDGDTLEVGYVTPLKSRWYYYEVVLTRSTRTIEIYVNGKRDVEYTLPDIFAQTSTMQFVFNPYDMLPSGQMVENVIYDDMYIRDGGRLGPIQISGRYPTSDVTSEWNPAEEGGTHFSQVGTMPPEPNDRFIFTAESDKLDTFKSTWKLPDDGRIISHGLVTLVRKATADPVSIVANIDSNTVTMANIGRSWEYRYTLFPAGGYNKSSIEAATFGVKSQL